MPVVGERREHHDTCTQGRPPGCDGSPRRRRPRASRGPSARRRVARGPTTSTASEPSAAAPTSSRSAAVDSSWARPAHDRVVVGDDHPDRHSGTSTAASCPSPACRRASGAAGVGDQAPQRREAEVAPSRRSRVARVEAPPVVGDDELCTGADALRRARRPCCASAWLTTLRRPSCAARYKKARDGVRERVLEPSASSVRLDAESRRCVRADRSSADVERHFSPKSGG